MVGGRHCATDRVNRLVGRSKKTMNQAFQATFSLSKRGPWAMRKVSSLSHRLETSRDGTAGICTLLPLLHAGRNGGECVDAAARCGCPWRNRGGGRLHLLHDGGRQPLVASHATELHASTAEILGVWGPGPAADCHWSPGPGNRQTASRSMEKSLLLCRDP